MMYLITIRDYDGLLERPSRVGSYLLLTNTGNDCKYPKVTSIQAYYFNPR